MVLSCTTYLGLPFFWFRFKNVWLLQFQKKNVYVVLVYRQVKRCWSLCYCEYQTLLSFVQCNIEVWLTVLFVFRFFGFNCYRLGIGIDYERYCSNDLQKSTVLENVPSEEIADNATLYSMTVISRDESTNETDLLVAYPCEFGFHYTTSGAAVWLAFLPCES